jgi:uncharacterized membrane-anchored protein YhcB (DUF1043 family)
MKNKNNLMMYGILAVIGGAIIYSMVSQNKKRNKLQLDVKGELESLQSQLQKQNKNISSIAIKQSPEAQQTISNLQRFGRNF